MLPKRILFVFNWLVVGGEETELRLLAKHLDPERYRLEVVACFHKEGMSEQTHAQLETLGVPVDRTPYTLSFEDTVSYLAGKLPNYDLVVATQAVPDVVPALETLEPAQRPPLIEHGGLVEEAQRGPKHLTARYVGVCGSIRDAAAATMPGREHQALMIPSMVDLSEFHPRCRAPVRRAWGVGEDAPVFGLVGRLDRKKRVEVFVEAAAHLYATHPAARFVVVGGPDAFMPEYAGELRALARARGLGEVMTFLGDHDDVPRLLSGLDALVWLSKGEGMPHVVAEAGAAGLAVVATPDNGVLEQLTDLETGLFVPYDDPETTAAAMRRLADAPELRRQMGDALRNKVEATYSAAVVTRQWENLFDTVLADTSSETVAAEPT
ncbi:hypothetical protein BH24DEI2_BH24DEI2_22730 [soil metagenome]